ncbi:phosphodiester glycosidase family protein [Niabella sp. CC-SYL272]|uniref:phosphodiester glycosidase family protein n=1 Tax=Niabella agricola TaxID=2891571 RepID=UPI001F22BAF7|nr:phosphodiester glycosidase family protein [Niabella agricola]MCF3108541.1 phosphodiester glycosidase family protein [Niabella agricola]
MKSFKNWKLLLLAGVLISCNKDYKDTSTALVGDKGAPSITGLSRVTGDIGDTLKIMGTFPKGGDVFFGNQQLSVVSANETEIVVVVPYGTGSAFVSVNAGALRSNKVTFTYNLPPAKEGVRIGDNYYEVDTASLIEIGPGTKYMLLNLRDKYTDNHLKVHLTFMDAGNPYLSFKPVLGKDTVPSMETVPNMAVRKSKAGSRYFVGINGDLFNNTFTAPPGINHQGRVNGSCIIDGLITNINYNFPAYAPVYFKGNSIYFDEFEFNSYVRLPNGQKIDIKNINNNRAQDDLILYNAVKGKHTITNPFGTEMSVTPVTSWGDYTNAQVRVNAKTIRADNKGSMPIPAGGAVISAHDFSADILNAANVGDILTVVNYAKRTEDGTIAQQMISGDLRILKNGNQQSPGIARAARTAIGASADKSTVVFCVIDLIPGVSVGASTTDLADILKLYGASDAVNLNGGAFSTMYVKGAGYNNAGLVNLPGNTTTAPNVGNGMFVISTAPDDATVVKLVADLYSVRVKTNGIIAPRFYGLNRYGHIVASYASGVTLSGGEDLGVISGTTFTAGTITGRAKIFGTYNGMTAGFTVNVVP